MALGFSMRLTVNRAAKTFRLDDVRLNGRRVNHLREVNAAGRLEFVASPGGQSSRANVGTFKSMTGLTGEMEIVDPGRPGEGIVVAARVVSAITKVDNITAIVREVVSAAIDKPQNRRVIIFPAER